jgi:hypothetical protein
LVFLRSVRQLLVAACVVPSSPIFVTLMKEAPGSSETLILTRATRRNNPEDTILHSILSFIFHFKLEREFQEDSCALLHSAEHTTHFVMGAVEPEQA